MDALGQAGGQDTPCQALEHVLCKCFGSMLQKLQKSYCQAKDFQIKEPTGASHSVLAPTQWLPACVSSASSALSSERAKTQAHCKGQYGNSIVYPCHLSEGSEFITQQLLVHVFDRQACSFLEVTYPVTSGLPKNIPVFEPAVWHDTVCRTA